MAAMLLLWVLGITGTAQAEIFTSIADIQGVLQAENGSIELVQAYIRAEYERLNAIRRYRLTENACHDKIEFSMPSEDGCSIIGSSILVVVASESST